MQNIIKNLNEVEKEELPENFHNEFMDRLLNEDIENKKIFKRTNSKKYISIAASFILIIFSVNLLLSATNNNLYENENNYLYEEDNLEVIYPSSFSGSSYKNIYDNTYFTITGQCVEGIFYNYALNYTIHLEVENLEKSIDIIRNIEGNILEYIIINENDAFAFIRKEVYLENFEYVKEVLNSLGYVVFENVFNFEENINLQIKSLENAYNTSSESEKEDILERISFYNEQLEIIQNNEKAEIIINVEELY